MGALHMLKAPNACASCSHTATVHETKCLVASFCCDKKTGLNAIHFVSRAETVQQCHLGLFLIFVVLLKAHCFLFFRNNRECPWHVRSIDFIVELSSSKWERAAAGG